jgi:hypothetical protein
MMSPPNRRSVVGLLLLAAGVAVSVPFTACTSDASDAPARNGASTSASSQPSVTAAGPSTSGAPATVTSSPDVGVTDLGPVGPNEPLELGPDVTVTVSGVQFIDVDARAPGETSGPAVAVTFDVRNESSTAVDLGQLAVAATYGDAVPAISTDADPAHALTATLAPGESRSGVYVFRVGDADRPSVLVTVETGAGPNVLRFQL